jgi:hydrogenase maturation protease
MRILIAGIGNIFFGDDAFGVEVARQLTLQPLPEDVRVVDFGIRALDLTYALLEGYDFVILVDAVARGGEPGTLYVLEPVLDKFSEAEGAGVSIEGHGMDPSKVLRLTQALGGRVDRVVIVGCEPATVLVEEEMRDGISEPVLAAVDEAVLLIKSLVTRILRGESIAAIRDDNVTGKEIESCLDK